MAASKLEHTSPLNDPRALIPNELKTLGPQSIKDEIMRLSTFGFYGIPIRIAIKSNGKKSAIFPPKYNHIITPQKWTENIKHIFEHLDYDPNGIAILTGPSALYVIDIDVADDEKKRSGLILWKRLVAQNTELDTLKAISGSGGLHFYFRIDQTNGLQKLNNFEGLSIDGVTYAVDGRGIGGVIFAPPTCYKGIDGTSMLYSWATEGSSSPKEMPKWLVDCVNMGRGNLKPGSTKRRSETCLESDSRNTQCDFGGDGENVPATIHVLDDKKPTLAQLEIQELLQKVANDRESVYGGSTFLADGNRSFQFRVKGARTCYLGKQHNGSNNFTVIQGCAGDFREVFYRCFGTACANDENTRFLGRLSIPAALEQVGVAELGIRDRPVSCTSNLRARLNESFMDSMVCRSDLGSASIFAKLFEHDRRVIYDAGKFWTWNSTTWVSCDPDATVVKNAFMYHMGRVKSFWMNRLTNMCNEELEKMMQTKDAELDQLARTSNESPSREDIQKMKSNETAILRAFENSKKRAEQKIKWQGPDVESVPIASRCLTPTEGYDQSRRFCERAQCQSGLLEHSKWRDTLANG